MQYEEILNIAAVAVRVYKSTDRPKPWIVMKIVEETNINPNAAELMVEAIDRYIDQCVPAEPAGFDNGVLVYLKEELDDDRYCNGFADTKLRTAQIGYISGHRGDGWKWVTWYAGPMAAEAAQCHKTEELGVVKTHAPFTA